MGALLSALWDRLSSYLAAIVAWFSGLIERIIEWFGAQLLGLIGQLKTFLMGLLPAEVVAYLNERPWEQLTGFMEAVNWFFPVYAMLGIIAGAYVLGGAVRLIRTVKSFVPTMGD